VSQAVPGIPACAGMTATVYTKNPAGRSVIPVTTGIHILRGNDSHRVHGNPGESFRNWNHELPLFATTECRLVLTVSPIPRYIFITGSNHDRPSNGVL
jgi:hypothetical protein